MVAERPHQRSRFFFERVVVAVLRTKNGGLDGVLIANAVTAAEPVNQQVLHLVHLPDRQISFRRINFRHLFGETLQQIAVSGHRLLEGIHHLGAKQVLRRNHIAQVVNERNNAYVYALMIRGRRSELSLLFPRFFP